MKPVLICMLATLGMGCTLGDESEAPLSYEEFQAKFIATYTDEDGVQHLYYDDDQPLESMDQVAKLYEIYHAAKTTGEQVTEATANTNVHGAIVKWNAQTAQNMTYCVTNNFGQYKNAIVTAVANAGAAWSGVTGGRVRFVHASQYDGNCNTATPVVFDVQPANISATARAFFPGYPRNQRRLLVNLNSFFGGNLPRTGVMRHELGHALGLRHETVRQEAIQTYGQHCFENIYYRALTAYDDMSVMTTPACMGQNLKNKQLTISALDAQGIRMLY